VETPEVDYQVVVGNVGTVYSGLDGAEAERIYGDYCVLSVGGKGRVGGEEVTLLRGGEVQKTYAPVRTVADAEDVLAYLRGDD